MDGKLDGTLTDPVDDRTSGLARADTAGERRYITSGMNDNDLDERRRRRILFRATHRGTHETDMLLGGFVTERLSMFSGAELDAIEAVMELPDVDLADWLTGRLPIPPTLDSPMLQAIRVAALHHDLPEETRHDA